jgi:DNA repair exonuclease SbcCD ATPase subunit
MNLDLPILLEATIDNFSLYEKKESIHVKFNKDVFCLIGANGLGKSTFISIITYALTGIVKKHDINFGASGTMPQFYSQNKSFAYKYFNGRIREEDRDIASVKLKFKLADAEFEITRSFFEVDSLRSLTVISDDFELKLDTESGETSGLDILNEYEKIFLKYSMLEQFDQFVFLQIFVLSFDESHSLLVWDDKVLDRVLHIVFSVDPKQAQKADFLRKEISKFESNARNKQYSIRQVGRLIRETELAIRNEGLGTEADSSIGDKFDEFLQVINGLDERKEFLSSEIKDTNVFIAEKSLAVSDARKDYEMIFSQIEKENIKLHEIIDIQNILEDLKLRLLSGTDYVDEINRLITIIKLTLKDNQSVKVLEDQLEELHSIDSRLSQYRIDLDREMDTRRRILGEIKDVDEAYSNVKKEISVFEQDNNLIFDKDNKTPEEIGLVELLGVYKSQIIQLEKLKEDSISQRDSKRAELSPLEDALALQYSNAKEHFIPLFNSYAESFLGLNIEIQLSFTSKSASFKLNIKDSHRKEAHQLSESQRYFIDIALRMALLNYKMNHCTMMVDTPEGSLDIAYESRAGKMFADFSSQESKLLMTANINSSKLLFELANICKNSRMKIAKMTEWTYLSEVQKMQQDSIDNAFASLFETLEND